SDTACALRSAHNTRAIRRTRIPYHYRAANAGGLWLLRSRLQRNRRSPKTEAPADLIDEVTLVGKMQRSTPVREQDERRRPDRCLRDVQNLALLESQLFDEAIQLGRRDPLRSGLVNLADELEERSDAGARLRREKPNWRIIEKFQLIANLAFELA